MHTVEATRQDAADTSERESEQIVVGGAWAMVINLARRHGPAATLAVMLLGGVGASIYNGCHWIGLHVVTPITDQHVKTWQALQQNSTDQSASLKLIERAMHEMTSVMENQNGKLDKILETKHETASNN